MYVCATCLAHRTSIPSHHITSHQTELETKIRGLQSREKHSSADLEVTTEELESIKRNQEMAEVDRAKVRDVT